MKDELVFSPFYASFLSLCDRDGISPTKAAKLAGISSGAPTAWKKKGSVPKPEQREKLCDLFKVTDEELLGYKPEIPIPFEVWNKLDPPTKELIELIIGMSEENVDALFEIAKRMKE